ncbi:RNA-guided endonuclease InsQ/TnpB family protein [Kitasatospora sp. NPDC058162]|uniref:RNA-guided endonuclease InsQ/TnpB family protein n=1 Tax=Kitasatospora sp. NPDC058162 TaxID=3346362 RepID=UPI0036DD87E7
MQLRYRYEAELNVGQRKRAARAFGCARVVFNDGLRLCLEADGRGEKIPSAAALSKLVVTDGKKKQDRAWLGEVSAVVLQQSVRDLGQAWSNHLASRKGTRKGPKVEQPSFKSKKDLRDAIRFTANARFKIMPSGRLRLPGIGEIEIKWSRDLPSDPTSVTLIRTPTGRFFVSFVTETDPAGDLLEPTTGETGIDLGLNRFAVLSDGSHIENPRFLRKATKKLAREQRRLARKEKGSNNRDKQRRKVAQAHAAVADARRDFHHQWSTRLISDNQAIYAETLNIRGLAKGRLAKSVNDAGWAGFLSMLQYKAAKTGRVFIQIDRTFPSSRLCSDCGHHDGPKPLRIRTWTCPNCQTVQDRDWNAARNIHTEGRRLAAAA